MHKIFIAAAMLLATWAGPAEAASVGVSGTDHTGSLYAINFKNWGTGAAAASGLPNYAYFEQPNGIFTSIVAEPLSASTVYAPENEGFTVFNKIVTESDFSTLSSGSLDFDDSGLTGVGTEFIDASSITFAVNAAGFSPISGPNNSGSGVGNAGWDYDISVTNAVGTGLTFIDGQLSSVDFIADVSVLPRFFGNPFGAFSDSFDGTVTFAGNGFQFDIDETKTVTTLLGTFTDARLVFDRSGTIDAVQQSAAVVPEPGTLTLAAIGAVGGFAVRRRRGKAEVA
ncbi:MAG: PEP-CTERM sorting domain-containing protein [Planctomycetota bacterium]